RALSGTFVPLLIKPLVHDALGPWGGWRQTAAGAFAASDAAGLVGPHGDFDAVLGAELSHEAGEVGFDGAWGDVELAGDLIVRAALGYRHEDFLLAGGEGLYRLPRW